MPTRTWFPLIVEAAPNAMLMVDDTRRIVLVNHAAEALFGYVRDELVGQEIELLLPERFRGSHADHVAAFLGDRQTRPMGAGRDLHGRRKDGTEVPIEIGLNPIDTPFGRFILASVIDITERKRADEDFRAVFEAAPNALLMIDSFRTITLVNRRTEGLFGYARDELVGQTLEILLPEAARERHPDHVREFLAAPQTRAMAAGRELFGRRRDGTEVPLEISLNPLSMGGGSFTLAAIIDITERKRREDELRRSNAELEQFAYIASHDLQEPLRMVANYTELLAQRYRGKLDDKADKYIYYATDGAKRMQQLILDLLAFSRIGSQGKPPEPVASQEVFDRVLRTLERTMREAGATVTADPLPHVLADAGQLAQLFQNLLGNAIKFRRPDVPVTVHVSVETRPNGVCFSVADNGIGIDMEHATRIFEMFQRLHERGRYEGSGIGLAIAKRIVERHGGRIWFTSEIDKGTTFYFTLQAARAAARNA